MMLIGLLRLSTHGEKFGLGGLLWRQVGLPQFFSPVVMPAIELPNVMPVRQGIIWLILAIVGLVPPSVSV
jgi:hypothetical protein